MDDTKTVLNTGFSPLVLNGADGDGIHFAPRERKEVEVRHLDTAHGKALIRKGILRVMGGDA